MYLGRVGKLREPYEDRGKLHHAQEVGGQFLEAHGNAAVVLDALKEVLDETAVLVEMAVEFSRLFTAGSGRNDGRAALRASLLDDGIGVVALVADDVGIMNASEQLLGLGHVVDLAFSDVEMNWISEGVDTRMNLRGWSATGTSDRLGSCFFSAPAAS